MEFDIGIRKAKDLFFWFRFDSQFWFFTDNLFGIEV